ncbi:MAG: CDP-glucose 4,6-dehydratase [Actinobacteria bacterium HGW-Actinobacteria-2]|nr:MAG: CDP-glucose 4,6-dehydratase [Actinobacteria bacterium HGW-Actinobacteria-2]
MHYLVTGHTGFKGAWLVQMLAAAGHEVSGLALAPVEGALFARAHVGELLVHDLRVDIRDAMATAAGVANVSPDVVIHLAAQPLVRESYRDPRTTWETNVNGTFNVLDAVANTSSVKAQVIITTDKVYRNVNRVEGYREDEPLGGHDPYSASKAAADLLTQSWIASSGCTVPTAIARAGNVVGGGDVCAERLMVDLVAAFNAGQDVHLRYPHAVRPWQHVLDCLAGYLALTDALLRGEQAGEAFNFGPGPASFVEVGAVAELVAQLWGTSAGVVIDPAPELHEAGLLALDAGKAQRELGWRDHLTFTDAMRWTVDWAKRVGAGEDPRQVCSDQIAGFNDGGQE